MSVFPTGKLKSWLRGLKGPKAESPYAREEVSLEVNTRSTDKLPNPYLDFYEDKFHDNPEALVQFALQSQSIAIRDVFARIASRGRKNLTELLAALETEYQAATPDDGKKDALLALAGLLSNTARDDLDIQAARQIFNFVFTKFGAANFSNEYKLQHVEVLNESARYEDVDSFSALYEIDKLAPLQYELLNVQRIRQTNTDVSAWLEAMNDLYVSAGLSKVGLLDDQSRPLLDRLSGHTSEPIEGPKVSVIMPTYAPGQGIWTAIRSLLDQTWQNIEIIVVDDASPVEYDKLFSDLGGWDNRVCVVRQTKNLGAYAARNVGLASATGAYITTHDDDDWSHPDKIAKQAEALQKNDEAVASTSSHIRTTEDMCFRRVNRRPAYLQMNYSSLMFRKSLVEDIGEWDSVNRSGDAEFVMRIVTNYGSSSIVSLSDLPLSFSRIWDGSLTSGEMARGFHAYSRVLYRWAFRQWQLAMIRAGNKVVLDGKAPRKFPAPTTFAPGARNSDLGLFDVIFVTDYFRQAKFVDLVLKQIATLHYQGFRVGFVHLASPQTGKSAGFPERLFELQLQGAVTQVSHSDIAKSRLLVVYDSSIGMFLDGIRSSVASSRSIVIDHTLPSLSGQDIRIPSIVTMSLRNMDICFGTTFEIVGATIDDQRRLYRQVPGSRLLPDSMIWKLHLDEKPSRISSPAATPIVGYHTYGNIYRWPSNAKTFESVYFSSHHKTRFYGNTAPVIKKYGSLVSDHAELVSRHEQDEPEFLDQIDFWVYYPHHRLQDQVSRPVLAAMQAGKVVILPKRLEGLYGSAALYADPEEVSEIVVDLANDADAYRHQAYVGQDFVQKEYAAETLRSRVEALISP